MFSPDDTIVAIATPPGRGGIGVVRVSGPRATAVAATLLDRSEPLAPRRATFTRVREAVGEHGSPGKYLDEVVATFFAAPHSYTGDDVIEVSAHGSPVVLHAIVAAAIAAGARLAEPGEFTLRAFLNGKLDLIQAEAVGDLVAAATPVQARVAFDQLEGTLTGRIRTIDTQLFDLIARLEASLDFPDEGYHFIEPADVAARVTAVIDCIDSLLDDAARGRMLREGAMVVIAGRTNVGKSSVFNALAGSARAIVTDVPGTTRDLVTERLDIEGLAVTLVDTAGARDALDVVEREGVIRGKRAREVADLVIVVLDRSQSLTAEDARLLDETAPVRRLIVANKVDLTAAFAMPDALRVSAVTMEGLPDLRRAIAGALGRGDARRDTAAISNIRHVALLEQARASLDRARDAAVGGAVPEEFVLADLQEARARFDEVVGRRTSDDLLRTIFERFCIGK